MWSPYNAGANPASAVDFTRLAEPAKIPVVWWGHPKGGSAPRWMKYNAILERFQEEEGPMQTSLIIESNGSGKEKLEDLLRDGWTVSSITANHGKSYNDFLIILEK